MQVKFRNYVWEAMRKRRSVISVGLENGSEDIAGACCLKGLVTTSKDGIEFGFEVRVSIKKLFYSKGSVFLRVAL